MVTIILNWVLFIFLALVIIILYVSFWVLAADKNKTPGVGFLIFMCMALTSLLFIPAQYIFKGHAPVLIWKILSIIMVVSSIMVLFFEKNVNVRRKAYLWGVFFTLITAILPFVIDISVTKHELPSIDFNNNYSIELSTFVGAILVSFIGIILMFFLSLNKIKRVQRSQNQLLMRIIDKDVPLDSTFRKPYERILKEELLSIVGILDRRITDVLKSNEKKNVVKSDSTSSGIKEIQRIQDSISDMQKVLTLMYGQLSSKQINDLDIIRDLNHFFATPFATIEANTELLKSTKGIDKTHLEKINNSIELCKCIIETYRECLSYSNNQNNIINSLKQTIEAAFRAYAERNNKKNLQLSNTDIPDKFLNHNNHYIVSVVLPLLENSIQAAPDYTQIEIVFDEKKHTICISNFCENIPTIKDLKTPRYSSKENHKGTGILIVNNLLSMKNRGVLNTTIENDKVIQTIKLNSNE